MTQGSLLLLTSFCNLPMTLPECRGAHQNEGRIWVLLLVGSKSPTLRATSGHFKMGSSVRVSPELETQLSDESQTVVPSAREHLSQVKPDRPTPGLLSPWGTNKGEGVRLAQASLGIQAVWGIFVIVLTTAQVPLGTSQIWKRLQEKPEASSPFWPLLPFLENSGGKSRQQEPFGIRGAGAQPSPDATICGALCADQYVPARFQTGP